MRKFLIFFLLLISLTVIVSCNTAENDDFENSSTTDVEVSADNDSENLYKYVIVCPKDLQELGVHRIISEYIKDSNGENIETVDETANYAGGV